MFIQRFFGRTEFSLTQFQSDCIDKATKMIRESRDGAEFFLAFINTSAEDRRVIYRVVVAMGHSATCWYGLPIDSENCPGLLVRVCRPDFNEV